MAGLYSQFVQVDVVPDQNRRDRLRGRLPSLRIGRKDLIARTRAVDRDHRPLASSTFPSAATTGHAFQSQRIRGVVRSPKLAGFSVLPVILARSHHASHDIA
jgi:hypothetical protein